MDQDLNPPLSTSLGTGSGLTCHKTAATAVDSLSAAFLRLDESARLAAEYRKFLNDCLGFSRTKLQNLHQEDLASWTSILSERRGLISNCLNEIYVFSEVVDRRRVAAHATKATTLELVVVNEYERSTRQKLDEERQAARQRLYRISRLLEKRVIT